MNNESVEHVLVSALQKDNSVMLSLSTVTDTNNKGFEIQRNFNNEDFQKVDIVSNAGSIKQFTLYFYNAKN